MRRSSLFLAALTIPSAGLLAQTASYTTFGSGCPSSVGHVVPRNAVNAWGNTANAWTLGASNQRWQQEIDSSEMPTSARPLFSLSWREDNANRSNPAHTLQLQILLGNTTYSSSTLTGTFATNATGPQKTVFNGAMNLPAVPGGNQQLDKFDYVAKFSAPYIYTPRPNENFLIEIVNTTATFVRRYPDAFSGAGTPGSRVYANNNSSAATGTVGLNHMMVMAFGTGGGTPPVLTNNGVPAIGKSFDVELSGVSGTGPAGLILGASKTQWAAFQLPLDMTAAGAPGCTLYASIDVVGGLAYVQGKGKVSFALPNNSSLLGVTFYNQFFVPIASANPLGLYMSNAGEARIGN